jgi:hypothetical protein
MSNCHFINFELYQRAKQATETLKDEQLKDLINDLVEALKVSEESAAHWEGLYQGRFNKNT